MRIRVSPPFGTGPGKWILMNSALSEVSAGTSPVAFASLPFTVSNFSSLPVLRSITRSFVATEPGRIGLKKNCAPSRVAVTSYVMANWCVSGGCNSYNVNSSAASSGTLSRLSINRIFGNIAGGVYHSSRQKWHHALHIAISEQARPTQVITNLRCHLLHIIGDEWLTAEFGRQQDAFGRWSALPPRFPPSQSNNSSPPDT